MLVPFSRWAGEYPRGAQRGAKVLVLASVLAVCLTAWALGGPVSGALAASIVGTSPFYSTMATLVMSDAVGAMLAVLPLVLLVRPGVRACVAAGAIAGAGFVVRLASVATLAALVIAPRRRRLALATALGALPFVVILLASQWATFGHPFETGYSYYFPTLREFDFSHARDVALDQKEGPFIVDDRLDGALMDWVCPCVEGGPMRDLDNVAFYPALVTGLFWVYTPPFVFLLALWELVRRRGSAVGRYGSLVIGSNVAMFIAYFHQGARFLAPTGAMITVFAALCGSRLASLARDRLARMRYA